LLKYCRVKEEGNILRKIKQRKEMWINHILRRKCLLKHATEGKIEGNRERMGRRGRKHNKLLDGLKETKGY
jgi:hypothetical protein